MANNATTRRKYLNFMFAPGNKKNHVYGTNSQFYFLLPKIRLGSKIIKLTQSASLNIKKYKPILAGDLKASNKS